MVKFIQIVAERHLASRPSRDRGLSWPCRFWGLWLPSGGNSGEAGVGVEASVVRGRDHICLSAGEFEMWAKRLKVYGP